MVSAQTTIVNATGLHARPASMFVAEAKKFASAIMMILAAGLGTGTKIEVACDGEDEQAALDALIALIDSGFGE